MPPIYARSRSRRFLVSALATAALTLFAVGCGGGGDDDGTGVEPADLSEPSDLLVTKEDIEDAKPDSPYGRLLAWWQAVQFRNIPVALTFYAQKPPAARLTAQLRDLQGLGNSRPVLFESRPNGNRVALLTVVRLAFSQRGSDKIATQDSPTTFRMVRTGGAWKLVDNSYLESRLEGQRRFEQRQSG